MDVRAFIADLLRALTDVDLFDRVTFHAEGPTVSGRAFLQEDSALFLRFYSMSKPVQWRLHSLKPNSEYGELILTTVAGGIYIQSGILQITWLLRPCPSRKL
jgi:hypothetical protein